jgi:hypothetical protein
MTSVSGSASNRNADDMWHYVRAAEAYLGVPRGK